MARQQVLREHVDLELAEAAAEGDLLRGRQMLIAEYEDRVLVVRLPDLLERQAVQLLRQVRADDLGSERRVAAADDDPVSTAVAMAHRPPMRAGRADARPVPAGAPPRQLCRGCGKTKASICAFEIKYCFAARAAADRIVMPSIRTFRTFLAVIKHGTFAGAGKEIGLTPAAVGLQIRAMEEEMKQVFFDRGGRSVVLNSAGRRALPQIEDLVRRYEALTVLGDTDELSGTVVMGALVSALMGSFADALWSLKAKHPRLEVQLFGGLSNDFAYKVEHGELDAAVVTQSPRPLSSNMVWTPLYSEPMVLIVPRRPHFALAHNSLEILRKSPFLQFDRQTWTGHLIKQVLDQCKVERARRNGAELGGGHRRNRAPGLRRLHRAEARQRRLVARQLAEDHARCLASTCSGASDCSSGPATTGCASPRRSSSTSTSRSRRGAPASARSAGPTELGHVPAVAGDDRLPRQRVGRERGEEHRDRGDVGDRREFPVHRRLEHHVLAPLPAR